MRRSDSPGAVNRRPVGGGDSALGMAASNHVVGAFGAAPTLAGNAQFKLDIVKAQSLAGQLGNGFVANAVADTNNHGSGGRRP